MTNKKQIKNENDFLGYLISVKDSENNVDLEKLIKSEILPNLDISELVNILESKNYTKQIDTCTLHLYTWGISAYIPTWKRIGIWIAKLLILTIKNLILFVGGILSGIIVAYATFLINNMF